MAKNKIITKEVTENITENFSENSAESVSENQTLQNTQGKPILLLTYDANEQSVGEYNEEYTVILLQTTQEAYTKDVMSKLKELANAQETENAMAFIAKMNELPKKDHLDLLKNATEFAEFATLTGRKDLSYVNKGDLRIFPYPAVTGNCMVISQLKLIKNAKYSPVYLQDAFIQLTMQISAKKCYIFAQDASPYVVEKSCKTC